MAVIDFPHIAAVRHAGKHTLWLRLSDGVEGHVDLDDWIESPAFEPLRDTELFAQARIDDSGTVSWPNGPDLAPEALYERLAASGPVRKRDYQRLFDDARRREAAECAAMPEISRFFGIIIRMFWREHEPPHFHAQYGEHVATIEVVSGAVTARRFPGKALQLLDEWRERHRDELLANWERMQRGEAPQPIAPLE